MLPSLNRHLLFLLDKFYIIGNTSKWHCMKRTRKPRGEPAPYQRKFKTPVVKDAPKTSAKPHQTTRHDNEILTSNDWMTIFAYVDEHPYVSQGAVVKHFASRVVGALTFKQRCHKNWKQDPVTTAASTWPAPSFHWKHVTPFSECHMSSRYVTYVVLHKSHNALAGGRSRRYALWESQLYILLDGKRHQGRTFLFHIYYVFVNYSVLLYSNFFSYI